MRAKKKLEIMNTIFLNQETVWGIAVKERGGIIGSIGLVDDQKCQYDMVKMIGYSIGEAYWGQGFMSEAVKEVISWCLAPQ